MNATVRFPNFWPILHLCLWAFVTFRFGLYAGLLLALVYGALLLSRWVDKITQKHRQSLLQKMPPALRASLPWLKWTGLAAVAAIWIWGIRWQFLRGDDPLFILIQHGTLVAFAVNHLLHRVADKAAQRSATSARQYRYRP